jgi:membrane protein
MTALVFLYFTAWIFIYGGELNAAIARERGIAAMTPERVAK